MKRADSLFLLRRKWMEWIRLLRTDGFDLPKLLLIYPTHGQPWNNIYTLVVTPHAHHLHVAAQYRVDNTHYISTYNSTHSFAITVTEIPHL
jgi:hypothetical protein